MKAVILAGGLGTRLAEETTVRPKPMVEIGGKPILWHIMKLYSAHGIDDFVVCLGHKGLASRVTPTTVTTRSSLRNVLPTALSPGQIIRASVSLTMATSGAPSRSAAVKSRPSTIGMRNRPR